MEDNKNNNKKTINPPKKTYKQIMAELNSKRNKGSTNLKNICDTHEDGA